MGLNWCMLENEIFINLNITLFCGQVFHFKRLSDCIFIGNVFDDIAILKQEDEKIFFIETSRTIKANLAKFFNLDIICTVDNIKDIMVQGLRFLTNDTVSTIFSFICSSNNNISRISKMVDYIYSLGEIIEFKPIEYSLNKDENNAMSMKLCEYEEKLISDFFVKNKLFAFPDLINLCNIEEKLREMKFGYRSKYICTTAQFLLKNRIDWTMLSYNEANDILQGCSGVGRKVADCICLIALRHFHVVPIDTHIARYSKQAFNLNFKTLNNKVYSEIQKLWLEKYGQFAGVAQLYIFSKEVNNRKFNFLNEK